MLNLPLFSSLEPDQVRTVDGDQFCERSHQWFIILGANCWDLCRFPFCCPNLPPWYCGEPAFVLLYQLEQHHDLRSSGSNDSFSAYTERSIENQGRNRWISREQLHSSQCQLDPQATYNKYITSRQNLEVHSKNNTPSHSHVQKVAHPSTCVDDCDA